jgi:REP element-mobilizing transposase RayT
VRFFDPKQPITKRRGQLPHWAQPGVTYFVTFRLADSLPEAKLRFLREEKEVWMQNHPPPLSFDEREEFSRLFSGRFDHWLDQGHGQCVLGLAEPRRITEESLRYFDKKRYNLGEFVVMPNHVHVLVTPFTSHPLEAVLQSWKSFTAHRINQCLGRTGQVWHRESFDHIARNRLQLEKFERYIRDNPKKWKA